MSWLSKFVKPKISALVKKLDTKSNLWVKCTGCGTMVYHKDLLENMNVCPTCDFHMKLNATERVNLIIDQGTLVNISLSATLKDPLKFKDSKKYTDKLRENKSKTNLDDAIFVAHGEIGGNKAVVAALDFSFMGGSMGTAVGEGFITAVEESIKKNVPFIIFSASGGARMQEGIYSLMQLPRTVIAVNKMKQQNIPYIVVLTDPTTGGVSASFAMLGDITFAEPGALIGFAGPRVIQSTVRETLPDGFQRAEYLLEHGMLDEVVPRQNLKAKIANLLSHLNQNLKSA